MELVFEGQVATGARARGINRTRTRATEGGDAENVVESQVELFSIDQVLGIDS